MSTTQINQNLIQVNRWRFVIGAARNARGEIK
jgi:hypothetical protein